MLHRFSREELLIGAQGLEKLQRARVAVFGIGGVGGYVVEALARSGVGALDLFDGDTVALTNINRQIIALESTVGRPKVEVARERVLQINPACQVEARQLFITPENAGEVDFSQYDYVADAIDTVSALKSSCCACAGRRRCRSSAAWARATSWTPRPSGWRPWRRPACCPLARVMRRELKKRGITGVKAVYSTEEALTPQAAQAGDTKGTAGRPTPGSMAFVPSVAGLILAGEIVRDLLDGTQQ